MTPTPDDLARDLLADLSRATPTADDLWEWGEDDLYDYVHFAAGAWPTAIRRAIAAEAEVVRLQAFKDWVHSYLDAQGVPHHPPGTHGAEGCRIGDRMDWLMSKLRTAEAEVARLGAGLERIAESRSLEYAIYHAKRALEGK